MQTQLSKINPSEVFPGVERLLNGLAHKFSERYGLDFDEARSDAFEGFMKACNNYRPGKGMKFCTWCHFVAWGHMQSLLMRRLTRRIEMVEINEELVGACPESFPEEVLKACDELHDLASRPKSLGRVIMTLFLESPKEILQVVESLSQEAQELFMLFAEHRAEHHSSFPTRADQVLHVKETFSQRYDPETTERAFREVRTQLAHTWAKRL